jgi:hypothetical protein
MAIEWQRWINQAESTAKAAQIRSDGNQIFRKRIFGSHSVEQLDQKRHNNAGEFNANLKSLSEINQSLVAEFGQVVGKVVFNQVFLSKIYHARPISASDIRLADSLGHSLQHGLDWLVSLDGQENAEKVLGQVFEEGLFEETSNLSADALTALSSKVTEQLQLAKTILEDGRRNDAQVELSNYIQSEGVVKAYLRAALLLQGEDRTEFLKDVRTRFGIFNPDVQPGAEGTNQQVHKQIEAVLVEFTEVSDVLEKESCTYG